MSESTEHEFQTDVFVTALEGGIGYWFLITGKYNPYAPFAQGMTIDDPTELTIDIDTIRRGLFACAADKAGVRSAPYLHPKMRDRILAAWRDLDAGELDADDCDVIVQLGLFGEVVYG